ncbi:hypothetical protein IAE22_28470 [Bacillus sp. S34]|nr:hypothetical protein [Bacillus sp. S34]
MLHRLAPELPVVLRELERGLDGLATGSSILAIGMVVSILMAPETSHLSMDDDDL